MIKNTEIDNHQIEEKENLVLKIDLKQQNSLTLKQ